MKSVDEVMGGRSGAMDAGSELMAVMIMTVGVSVVGWRKKV